MVSNFVQKNVTILRIILIFMMITYYISSTLYASNVKVILNAPKNNYGVVSLENNNEELFFAYYEDSHMIENGIGNEENIFYVIKEIIYPTNNAAEIRLLEAIFGSDVEYYEETLDTTTTEVVENYHRTFKPLFKPEVAWTYQPV